MGTRRIPTLRILLHFPRKTEGHFFLPSDTLLDVIKGQLWLSHPMITCNPSNCAYYPHLCHFSEISSLLPDTKNHWISFPSQTHWTTLPTSCLDFDGKGSWDVLSLCNWLVYVHYANVPEGLHVEAFKVYMCIVYPWDCNYLTSILWKVVNLSWKNPFVLVGEMSSSLKVFCMKNSESFWDICLKFRFSGGSKQRMNFSI